MARSRGPNTRKRLSFHTDRTDVIAFLCLRQAKAGGENDVVSIQGTAHRPEQLMYDAHTSHNGDFTLEEGHWGDFYRQIILPDEIDPERAEAKTKDGVLALRLPLVGKQGKGLRLNVVRADDHHVAQPGTE